jgi:cytochrome c biogenesis protein CcmG, thiol:disulfide interchange protein DsbE
MAMATERSSPSSGEPSPPITGSGWRGARLVAAAVGLALGVLLLVLAVGLARGVGQAEQGLSDAGGAQAAPFTAPIFEASRVHEDGGGSVANADGDFVLTDYADRPIFLYFWASWCAPCRAEAPVIEELWPEYRDRGYVFLGLNIWDIPQDAEGFLREFALTFPTARDAERSVYVEYGVQGLPVAFFIEPGLRIRSRYDGSLDESALRRLLDEIAVSAGESS